MNRYLKTVHRRHLNPPCIDPSRFVEKLPFSILASETTASHADTARPPSAVLRPSLLVCPAGRLSYSTYRVGDVARQRSREPSRFDCLARRPSRPPPVNMPEPLFTRCIPNTRPSAHARIRYINIRNMYVLRSHGHLTIVMTFVLLFLSFLI